MSKRRKKLKRRSSSLNKNSCFLTNFVEMIASASKVTLLSLKDFANKNKNMQKKSKKTRKKIRLISMSKQI